MRLGLPFYARLGLGLPICENRFCEILNFLTLLYNFCRGGYKLLLRIM